MGRRITINRRHVEPGQSDQDVPNLGTSSGVQGVDLSERGASVLPLEDQLGQSRSQADGQVPVPKLQLLHLSGRQVPALRRGLGGGSLATEGSVVRGKMPEIPRKTISFITIDGSNISGEVRDSSNGRVQYVYDRRLFEEMYVKANVLGGAVLAEQREEAKTVNAFCDRISGSVVCFHENNLRWENKARRVLLTSFLLHEIAHSDDAYRKVPLSREEEIDHWFKQAQYVIKNECVPIFEGSVFSVVDPKSAAVTQKQDLRTIGDRELRVIVAAFVDRNYPELSGNSPQRKVAAAKGRESLRTDRYAEILTIIKESSQLEDFGRKICPLVLGELGAGKGSSSATSWKARTFLSKLATDEGTVSPAEKEKIASLVLAVFEGAKTAEPLAGLAFNNENENKKPYLLSYAQGLRQGIAGERKYPELAEVLEQLANSLQLEDAQRREAGVKMLLELEKLRVQLRDNEIDRKGLQLTHAALLICANCMELKTHNDGYLVVDIADLPDYFEKTGLDGITNRKPLQRPGSFVSMLEDVISRHCGRNQESTTVAIKYRLGDLTADELINLYIDALKDPKVGKRIDAEVEKVLKPGRDRLDEIGRMISGKETGPQPLEDLLREFCNDPNNDPFVWLVNNAPQFTGIKLHDEQGTTGAFSPPKQGEANLVTLCAKIREELENNGIPEEQRERTKKILQAIVDFSKTSE